MPRGRLSLAEIAREWGLSPASGQRSVAGYDEDALTMAVDAASAVLDGSSPDAVWFASTSAPYVEKQSATVLAAAIDAPHDVRTTDIAASLRGWTGALAAAADAVAAGSARRALVACGDMRPAAPESSEESAFADAGGAAMLELEGDGAALLAMSSVNDATMGAWRRSGDRFVRHGEQRFAMRSGEIGPARAAVMAALARAGVDPSQVATLAVAASSARVAAAVAAELGSATTVLSAETVGIGNAGVAQAPVLLTAALAAAEPGQVVVLVATGDGADAVVLRAGAVPRGAARLADVLARTSEISSYASFLRRRGALPGEASAPRSSPVAQRRDEGQTLRLHAMRCRACGQVQYPVTELCARCASSDTSEQPMARLGTIHTYTIDHIVAGINPGIGESPITMAVIDVDDGARAFLQLTDHPPAEIRVGGRVELCFRLLHDGSEYHNYYWKARPVAGAEG